jgi:hypothetical protein
MPADGGVLGAKSIHGSRAAVSAHVAATSPASIGSMRFSAWRPSRSSMTADEVHQRHRFTVKKRRPVFGKRQRWL